MIHWWVPRLLRINVVSWLVLWSPYYSINETIARAAFTVNTVVVLYYVFEALQYVVLIRTIPNHSVFKVPYSDEWWRQVVWSILLFLVSFERWKSAVGRMVRANEEAKKKDQ